VGTNVFVVSVMDQTGLRNNATVNIQVSAPPAIQAQISQQAGSLTLNLSGGIGPYQVQMSTKLASTNWTDIGTVSGTNLTITPSNTAAFYQIGRQ
jgi:hypothetical protein